MIYYKADENNMVTIFTKSAQSAKDYHLTEICADDGLEKAWDGSLWVRGYAPEEPEEHKKEVRKKELIAELYALDLKEIRSLAAKAAGTATDEDIAILADLEEQKVIKRQELKELDHAS